MNWAVHVAANAAVAVAAAALAARGRPSARAVLAAFAPMAASNAIDADHLLADPVYDPARCSIGFHPLHGAWSAIAYALLLVPARTRWLGLGALTHLALDGLDCVV